MVKRKKLQEGKHRYLLRRRASLSLRQAIIFLIPSARYRIADKKAGGGFIRTKSCQTAL